jgi:transposase-like protein
MVRPYSNDLRERLVRAVLRGGLSFHQAAAQLAWPSAQPSTGCGASAGPAASSRTRSGATMTFLAALRHDRITAPWHIDGPIKAKPSNSTSKRS